MIEIRDIYELKKEFKNIKKYPVFKDRLNNELKIGDFVCISNSYNPNEIDTGIIKKFENKLVYLIDMDGCPRRTRPYKLLKAVNPIHSKNEALLNKNSDNIFIQELCKVKLKND